MTKVPFVDLQKQYEQVGDELWSVVAEIMSSCMYASGAAVVGFEEAFADYCGTSWSVGVGSGTEALYLALQALDVGPGDEVITVPNTFFATAEAITLIGATPVFIDVDARTYNMDAGLLEAAITERTRAVIPVHLYGQMADMDPILEIAHRRGLKVIEDASQAHGACYGDRTAGSLGDCGCFSFYPSKNLGAAGEAGAVTTDDEGLAARIRRLRDHGQSQKYEHAEVGWNARMDNLQGAVLGVKLPYLPGWNERRVHNADRYDALLADVPGVETPYRAPYGSPVFHLYEISVGPDRDRLLAALQQVGVGCAVHYPIPVHLQAAYRDLGHSEGSFPISEASARELISLPMYPELSAAQAEYVAGRVSELVAAAAAV